MFRILIIFAVFILVALLVRSKLPAYNSSGLGFSTQAIISGLQKPFSVNLDRDGRIYVTEFNAGKLLVYSSNGKLEKWLASPEGEKTGFKWYSANEYNVDFPISKKSFWRTHHTEFDEAGNFYITAFDNNIVAKFTSSGEFIGSLGIDSHGAFTQGFTLAANTESGTPNELFLGPATTVLCPDNHFYVTAFNASAVLKYGRDGRFKGWLGSQSDGAVSTWGSVGKPVASKQEGGFDRPHMVAMDKQGFLYVADTWNYRVQKFSSEGQFMGWIGLNQNTGKITDGWTMGGKPVETDQAGIPVAIAIGANDRLIVLDYMPGRLRVFSLDGKLLGSLDGFSKPYGLAVRGSTLYVADTSHGQIVKITLTEK